MEFPRSKPVTAELKPSNTMPTSTAAVTAPKQRVHHCDICGSVMQEANCKVICRNCGNRFDCSDLTIYFD